MQSLLQVKHRQTSIIKCFRYTLSIIGSHFSLILQKWGAVIDRWQIRSGQNPNWGVANPRVGNQTQRVSAPPPRGLSSGPSHAPPPLRHATLMEGVNLPSSAQARVITDMEAAQVWEEEDAAGGTKGVVTNYGEGGGGLQNRRGGT